VIPSYLLSLREGLEAALLIGIVLGALKKMGHSRLNPVVWGGTVSAVVISILVAQVLIRLGTSLEGDAEKIFEGTTMLLAAGVLTWMIFWMRSQARSLKSDLESDIRQVTLGGGKKALFILAFVAILREGVELALFLTAARMTSSAQQTLIGAALGLGTAILLGWSLFATTAKLNLRRFFQVTGVLLIIFAAGLVAHGVHEFVEVGWIPPIIDPLWDVNFVLSEKSPVGLILNALFGYNGDPSLTEIMAYLAYFFAIFLGFRLIFSSNLVTRKV
jgi:high-affinity iron transporter